MSRKPDVTLTLGSSPYQKTLPKSLASAGMLRRVLKVQPDLEIQDPGRDGALEVIKRFPLHRFANRVLWGTWRRLPGKLRGELPTAYSAILADWLLSRWIESSSIFHGYAGLSLALLRAAKRQRAITLIDQPFRHPRRWRQAVIEECRRFGVQRKEAGAVYPDVLLRRIEREYQTCDYILVPSRVAHESFAELGYAEKTLIVRTGTDAEYFFPRAANTQPPRFRVCYAGRVEFAKGVGYLLQAWKRLGARNAELLLVGEVKPEAKALLNSSMDSNVRAVGFASPPELARYYRESTLFVFPSANEGLAQVLLEAMASGLAVVATDKSGASECVTEWKEGLVVPAQDEAALAEALLWCYQHPCEVQEMGKAARARVESEFTLEHYNQRMIALYLSLASKSTPTENQFEPASPPSD